jgi:hypothetical protein
MDIKYYNKYLKYKQKYLELEGGSHNKKSKGGIHTAQLRYVSNNSMDTLSDIYMPLIYYALDRESVRTEFLSNLNSLLDMFIEQAPMYGLQVPRIFKNASNRSDALMSRIQTQLNANGVYSIDGLEFDKYNNHISAEDQHRFLFGRDKVMYSFLEFFGQFIRGNVKDRNIYYRGPITSSTFIPAHIHSPRIDSNPSKIDSNPSKTDRNSFKIDRNPPRTDHNPPKKDRNSFKIDRTKTDFPQYSTHMTDSTQYSTQYSSQYPTHMTDSTQYPTHMTDSTQYSSQMIAPHNKFSSYRYNPSISSFQAAPISSRSSIIDNTWIYEVLLRNKQTPDVNFEPIIKRYLESAKKYYLNINNPVVAALCNYDIFNEQIMKEIDERDTIEEVQSKLNNPNIKLLLESLIHIDQNDKDRIDINKLVMDENTPLSFL